MSARLSPLLALLLALACDPAPSTPDGGAMRPPDGGGADAGHTDAGVLSDAALPEPVCPDEGASYMPTSAAELGDPANAGKTAIIASSFDCDGCTLAEAQTLVAGGGVITGVDIDLAGACIRDSFEQVFSPEARFREVYDRTRLSPELFGARGDGLTPDDAAIDALVVNSALATAREGARYVKNAESHYTRAGDFDWDLDGAAVVTTDAAALSHGPETSNQSRYLFFFDGTSPSIRNGELDGGDLASRLFRVERARSFHFERLNVHHYLAPEGAYARGVAFFLKPAPTEHGFVGGAVRDTRIAHIGAASNGVANDAPYGVSKAVWVSVADNGAATVTLERLEVEDIYGDDAEGFYASPAFGSDYDYQASELEILVTDSTFRACQRRALKINASNVVVRDTTMESATNDWLFSGAQAAMLQVFSIRSGQPIEGIEIRDSEVRVVGDARNTLFAITDADDCVIEDNVFEANRILAQSSISFGVASTQGGLYSGDLSRAVVFRGNQITNAFLQLSPIYDPVDGGPTIAGNTQRLVLDGDNPGVYWAALRLGGLSGETEAFTLADHTIDCEITSGAGLGLFGGVLNTQGVEPRGLTLRNVDISYSGDTAPRYPFAYMGRNGVDVSFGSSNRIESCDLTGQPGTGAVVVPGPDRDVQIIDSFGDGATPLSVR